MTECNKTVTWQPRVSFHPQKVWLHWSHVRPTVLGGHVHWPEITSQTFFSPLQPHSEVDGKNLGQCFTCHLFTFKSQLIYTKIKKIFIIMWLPQSCPSNSPVQKSLWTEMVQQLIKNKWLVVKIECLSDQTRKSFLQVSLRSLMISLGLCELSIIYMCLYYGVVCKEMFGCSNYYTCISLYKPLSQHKKIINDYLTLY